jgi:hypothetical protein
MPCIAWWSNCNEQASTLLSHDTCDKTSAEMLSDLRTRDFHSPRSLFTARIPVSDDEKAGNMKSAGAVACTSFLKIPRMIKGRPCDAATVANHGHGMR